MRAAIKNWNAIVLYYQLKNTNSKNELFDVISANNIYKNYKELAVLSEIESGDTRQVQFLS